MKLLPVTSALASLVVGAALVVVAPSAGVARPTAPPDPTSPPAPTFTDVSVHDPDLVQADGRFYVFGSHLTAASTTDFQHWTPLASGVTPTNPLFDDVTTQLRATLDWAQSDTLWAPSVIRLADGRYYMYYDACKGDSPRSALGVAVADKVTGPYHDLGIILRSGMWGQPSEDGTVYDARVHPNTVDPDVFFDAQGKLWMVYGSYSGGIFILQLDPGTGKPFPGQGYGKHLAGGNHARIEGPTVMYDQASGYYYLFVTFGGLDSTGGYNIRVARSRTPDGPYLDSSGTDMATVKADPTKPLFDDASIAPYGTKLMGSYLFQREVGDPGTGIGTGYVSPGGVSPYVDPATGQMLLVLHTRFPGQGETHQVRVHRMYLDADGWPVVAPLRYAGESEGDVKRAQMVGTYAYLDHGKAISAVVTRASTIRLEQDGTVSGAVTGTWEKEGRDGAALVLDGRSFSAVFSTQWDPDARTWTTTFSGLSPDGRAAWGVQRAQVDDATVVQRVLADLTVPASTVADLTLPTTGTQGSSLVWASSDPAVVEATGVVHRPAVGQPDAVVQLTVTVTSGAVTGTRTFSVTVPAQQAAAEVAHYTFDGTLASTGTAAAGRVSGPRIAAAGGTVAYTDGVTGQALHLDGSTGVRLPDGVVGGSSYSVSVWLRPGALTPYTTAVFGAKDANSWVSLLPMGHAGVYGHTMVWSGSSWFDGDGGRTIPVGRWTHVALSVDAGHVQMWFDGVKVLDRTGFPDALATTTAVWSLGVNWWDTPYQGDLDDLRLFSGGLTDAQVTALAQR